MGARAGLRPERLPDGCRGTGEHEKDGLAAQPAPSAIGLAAGEGDRSEKLADCWRDAAENEKAGLLTGPGPGPPRDDKGDRIGMFKNWPAAGGDGEREELLPALATKAIGSKGEGRRLLNFLGGAPGEAGLPLEAEPELSELSDS